jgi:hypothetical protein
MSPRTLWTKVVVVWVFQILFPSFLLLLLLLFFFCHPMLMSYDILSEITKWLKKIVRFRTENILELFSFLLLAFFWLNIIRVIKSMRMRWTKYVASNGKMGDEPAVTKSEVKWSRLRRPVAGMIILGWNLMRFNTKARTGLIWLRMIDWWLLWIS